MLLRPKYWNELGWFSWESSGHLFQLFDYGFETCPAVSVQKPISLIPEGSCQNMRHWARHEIWQNNAGRVINLQFNLSWNFRNAKRIWELTNKWATVSSTSLRQALMKFADCWKCFRISCFRPSLSISETIKSIASFAFLSIFSTTWIVFEWSSVTGYDFWAKKSVKMPSPVAVNQMLYLFCS